ncbi:MAG: LysR family transcriptional regulator [Myxococcota bacterium]
MRLSQIDTNLLVALDVLLQERHVTRAAQRLGITQSAMSQTLGRLRDILGDPILVRSGRAMVTTPRCEALAGPLRIALRDLERVFTDDAVDPGSITRSFTLTCLDTYAISLVPELFSRVAATAPGIDVTVVPYDRDRVWEQLRGGETELAITGFGEVPSDMVSVPFLAESMLGVVRRGHPLLDGELTAERYAHWPHAVFRITGRGTHAVDRHLSDRGLERRIVGRTPYFLSAPAIVAGSDLIMTVPTSAARIFAQHWALELFEPPIGPMPYQASLTWARWMDADPGHQWLREQVLEIGEAMASS